MVLLESFVEALTLMVVDKSSETSRHLLCAIYTIYCNLYKYSNFRMSKLLKIFLNVALAQTAHIWLMVLSLQVYVPWRGEILSCTYNCSIGM